MQNGAGLMSFSVIIAGRELRCRVTYSKRKSIALKLLPGDIVSIKCPYFTSKAQLEALLQKNGQRILKQLQGLENAQPPLSETELEQLKRQARQDITARVQRYASLMGLEYGRIAIRAQKSRWGSCSGKKNRSLTDIVRTRFAGHLFAPDFISFFAGRQPGGITQFRLTQKSAPAKSEISESV